MMNLQYIVDNQGVKKGVFIPMQDWEAIKEKINGLEAVEKELMTKNLSDHIPDEHKVIVSKRIEKYKNSPESYLSEEKLEAMIKFD
ncbi:MAG: hypothetical protein U9R19_09200 [Bacteroidota bacterium]|nr:hypothetical protein [Bacteroidota bacterium]